MRSFDMDWWKKIITIIAGRKESKENLRIKLTNIVFDSLAS